MANSQFDIPETDPPQQMFVCKCEDPVCEECLQEKCQDLDCTTHSKNKKIEAKKELLLKYENYSKSIMDSGHTWLESMPYRAKFTPLRDEIAILEGKEPETHLHMDYQPGYGPNGSVLERVIFRIRLFLFAMMLIAIPIFALLGLYYLATLVF